MGKRIGIIGGNSSEYVSILLNIWYKGDCAVLVDGRMPQMVVIEMLKEAEVENCYIEHDLYKGRYVSEKSLLFVPYFKEKKLSPFMDSNLYERFSATYSNQEAVVIFSSGTTGKSKGVILSHNAINTNAEYVIKHQRIDKRDKILLSRSFTYTSGLSDILLTLKSGIKAVLTPVGVHPRYSLSLIQEHEVSRMGLVPMQLLSYLNELERVNITLPSLKSIHSAGAFLPGKTIKKTEELLPYVKLFNNYGLSEAAPRVTGQNDTFKSHLSSGVPISNQIKLRIVDKDQNLLIPKNIGVIEIKTPTVFSGYINTFETPITDDGWLKTNDLGYLDEDGELFVKGRVDDAILSKAKIVYPEEVEAVILSVFGVKQCVVFGQIDSLYGEKIICLYVADTDISDKIRICCEGQLMEHEIPKEFILIKEIPKTINGKISRKSIRDIYRKGKLEY